MCCRPMPVGHVSGLLDHSTHSIVDVIWAKELSLTNNCRDFVLYCKPNSVYLFMMPVFSLHFLLMLACLVQPVMSKQDSILHQLLSVEPHLIKRNNATGNRSRRQLPTEIAIQVTAPLFKSRLYDYGPDSGDNEVPPSSDIGVKLDLKFPLTFYGQKFTEIYILSNGGIGFDLDSHNYKPDIFRGGPIMIAPFWNRNDLRKGGKIFYREITEGKVIERAESEINYQYDKTVKPRSVLLVTWVHMQPVGEEKVDEDNSNTFQVATIISDNGTFANFIYKSIGWSRGAEVGFSKGDKRNFYSLPTSGTGNIMLLKEEGNTGIPGEWMFEIGENRINRCKIGIKGDTCDEECAEYEWGQDCDQCCHCANGKCDRATGQCPGQCKPCWKNAPYCDKRDSNCRVDTKQCGFNAISFTDYGKCGEPMVRCQCMAGFIGDGMNCTDVDECSKPNTCSPLAICYNTPGRYQCQCQYGYTGNGTFCTSSSQTEIITANRSSTSAPTPLDTVSSGPPIPSDWITNATEGKTEFEQKTTSPASITSLVTLPKDIYSKITYTLHQPITIFMRHCDQLTISSMGLITLDDLPPITPDDDLDQLRIVGFAPFFGRIDLSERRPGGVSVRETSHSSALNEATNLIGTYFNSIGFMARSILTISFDNITTGEREEKNNFRMVLISGVNSTGDNVTFLEYVYSHLEWTEGAQAMIMPEDTSSIIHLPGSGSDSIIRLSQLSNIGHPGQWLYRVDGERVLCPSQSSSGQSFCANEVSVSETTPGTTAIQSDKVENNIGPNSTPNLEQETVQLPALFTIRPKLVTSSTLPVPPAVVPFQGTTPTTDGPPQPPSLSPDDTLPGPPRPPSIRPISTSTVWPAVQTWSIADTSIGPMGPTSSPEATTATSNQPSSPSTTMPPLQIFTATTKKTTGRVGPSRPEIRVITGTTGKYGRVTTPTREETNGVDGESDQLDGINTPSRLAIIIPSAVVGLWLVFVIIIGAIVCWKRRRLNVKHQCRSDPRINPSANSVASLTPSTCATSGIYIQPNFTPGDHQDKLERHSEMSQYANTGSRSSISGSHWNIPNAGYYNQGYYESCSEFNRNPYKNGRRH